MRPIHVRPQNSIIHASTLSHRLAGRLRRSDTMHSRVVFSLVCARIRDYTGTRIVVGG